MEIYLLPYQLWNLEYLIAHRKLSIVKSYGNSSNLPMEIWDMKELKHLQVMGSNLPNPCEGSFLPNLLTLLDVCHQTCTLNVLEKIPYLRKLGIRIELSPDNSHQPLSCFDHISHLHELKSLKCVVVNPVLIKTEIVAPLSIYSTSLEKLTLSGFGYPWEDISKVSLLSNLQVLKLRCYAFRGPKWEVRWKDFRRLKHLLIEDSDLEHWIFRDDKCLRVLESVVIKHCYKLKEIPMELAESLEKIELVDWDNNICKDVHMPLMNFCASTVGVIKRKRFKAQIFV